MSEGRFSRCIPDLSTRTGLVSKSKHFLFEWKYRKKQKRLSTCFDFVTVYFCFFRQSSFGFFKFLPFEKFSLGLWDRPIFDFRIVNFRRPSILTQDSRIFPFEKWKRRNSDSQKIGCTWIKYDPSILTSKVVGLQLREIISLFRQNASTEFRYISGDTSLKGIRISHATFFNMTCTELGHKLYDHSEIRTKTARGLVIRLQVTDLES